MKKYNAHIDDDGMVLLIIAIILLIIMVLYVMIITSSCEINKSQYMLLREYKKEFPVLKEDIDKAFEDKEIDQNEFDNIQDHYFQLKKAELINS